MATNRETQAATTEKTGSQAAAEDRTLTLKSSDGEEFEVPESVAVLSPVIKIMVDEDCSAGRISLPNIEGKTLAQIICYLGEHAKDSLSVNDLNNFDEEFVAGESLEVLFDYILAAKYLGVTDLIKIVSSKIADLIKDKSVEQVQQLFSISDFLEEEEVDKIKVKYSWTFENSICNH